ncbi:MAG: hypothetical protein ACRD0Y_09230 [Terriglobales bacterium]
MSYLDLPRFSFLGSFYTEASTVDNDPAHYDPACTRPAPWQDPGGAHYFSFHDLYRPDGVQRAFTPPLVTGGVNLNGNALGPNDLLLGAAVDSVGDAGAGGTNRVFPARLVDLDVYQQGVSTIFGFTMTIKLDSVTISGLLDRCELNNARFDRVLPTRGWNAWDSYGAGYGGDTYASGAFQSILRVDPKTWPSAGTSPLLDQLRASTFTDPAGNIMLSIRLTMDDYRNQAWSTADFRIGRVLGTVGPVTYGEPTGIIGKRWLNGRAAVVNSKNPKLTDPWYQPSFYGAPFQIVARQNGTQVLVADFSNALATTCPGGPPVDLGNAVARIGDGSTGDIGPFSINQSLYTVLGGIVELPLNAAQWAARGQPVTININAPGLAPVPWAEASNGLLLQAVDRVVRLASEADSPAWQGKVCVTQWGVPAGGVQLAIEAVPVVNGIKGATVPWVAGYEGDTPQATGAVKASIVPTDQNGEAVVTLQTVADPGNRSPWLESQLYFVVPYFANTPPPNLMQQGVAQEQMISCVAWSRSLANENPTWEEVQALMAPYAKLFPAMTAVLDLTDRISFQTFALNPPWQAPGGGPPIFNPPTPYTLPNGKTIARGAIPYFLTRTIDDPRTMPVTRDLSPNRILTVLYFCYNLQQQYPPNTGSSK